MAKSSWYTKVAFYMSVSAIAGMILFAATLPITGSAVQAERGPLDIKHSAGIEAGKEADKAVTTEANLPTSTVSQADLADKRVPQSAQPTPAKIEAASEIYWDVARSFHLLSRLPSEDPCQGHGTSIMVLSELRAMYLCDNGKDAKHYYVSLGRNGTSTCRHEGDGTTPVGTYNLDKPAPHETYHQFINTDFPNAKDRANGCTGSLIYIHGPSRMAKNLGAANAMFDWTAGCVAVTSDKEIEEVSSWVRKHPGVTLTVFE